MKTFRISEIEKKVWTGSYLGVGFEVNNFETSFMKNYGMDNWTYYLFIHINRLPEGMQKEFWLRPKKDGKIIYYSHHNSILNNIEFHNGITWYSKESGFDGEIKIIKVGCDYAHLWDTERRDKFELEHITNDVKISIESFKKIVPDYKYYCLGNGELYFLSEGNITKDGRFISNEYKMKSLNN